jgi:hypothetical protein
MGYPRLLDVEVRTSAVADGGTPADLARVAGGATFRNVADRRLPDLSPIGYVLERRRDPQRGRSSPRSFMIGGRSSASGA